MSSGKNFFVSVMDWVMDKFDYSVVKNYGPAASAEKIGVDAVSGADVPVKDVNDLASQIRDDIIEEKPNDATEGYFGGPSTPQQRVYVDAPYAELYGMDASTAYQEALANTAYQRKVKDLQAAGLNPVLGYSGSGAASFYGIPAQTSGGIPAGSSGSGKTSLGLNWAAGLPFLASGLTLAATKSATAATSVYNISKGLVNIFDD